MRITVIVLSLLLAVLCYKLFISQEGIRQMVRLRESLSLQEEKNKQLLARNTQLLEQVNELKKGRHAVEAHARADLGMIKDNETYYQFVKAKQ